MKIIPIAQWSASKAKTFEQCKLKAQLQYGQKIPEPERPLPQGKTEHANDRGSRIHLGCENFVQDKGPFPPEMEKFRPELEALKRLYLRGKVSLEGEWAMDRNWDPIDWSDKKAWLRLKLDAIAFISDTEAVVIDYKTGKKFGNEISHAQQTQLYQLVAFLRYPELEIIHTELWYPDVNELTQNTFTRQQGLRFMNMFTRKGLAITECEEFPPSPSIFGCRYCWYSKREGGTGHCERGVY